MTRAPIVAVALAVAVLLAGACGSSTPSRPDVLTDLADQTIIPAYADLAETSTELQAAAAELCASPDPTTLDRTVAALAATDAAWSYTEAMWTGPVMERRSWAVIDWPIAIDEIEELIADTTTELDTEWLAQHIGADQRGLGAVEYIVAADEPETVLAALGEPRRCAYLTGITTVIVDEAALLPDDWAVAWENSGPYRDVFSAADGTGLDSVVNDALFLLEAISDAELGRALGVMDAAADPGAINEGPAGLGLADIERHLTGLRAVLVGSDSTPGLSPLLGDSLTERLAEQFDAATASLGAIDGPLRAALDDSTAELIAARDAIKTIQVTVSTEVVSRLGVTIGFSDADGDSSS